MTVTYLVATVGRPSLEAALQSIVNQSRPGDEVLVIGATSAIQETAHKYGCRYVFCEPGNDWGATERNVATPYATGDYLAFLDDDDLAAPGSRAAIEHAISLNPGLPAIFRMQYGTSGPILWGRPELALGNVGTPMFILPNDRSKLGIWTSRYGGDFDFISSMQWAPDSIVWRGEVIANIRPQ